MSTTIKTTTTTTIINFGKHAGTQINKLEANYLTWLATHEANLKEENRWASAAAQIELERRAQVAAQAEAVKAFEARCETSLVAKAAKSRKASVADIVAAKVAQAERLSATGAVVNTTGMKFANPVGGSDLGTRGNLYREFHLMR